MASPSFNICPHAWPAPRRWWLSSAIVCSRNAARPLSSLAGTKACLHPQSLGWAANLASRQLRRDRPRQGRKLDPPDRPQSKRCPIRRPRRRRRHLGPQRIADRNLQDQRHRASRPSQGDPNRHRQRSSARPRRRPASGSRHLFFAVDKTGATCFESSLSSCPHLLLTSVEASPNGARRMCTKPRLFRRLSLGAGE